MFGDRYFGARYFGNRYFGPSGAGSQWAPEIDDGHDGKPSSEAWDEHRQKAEQLRDTLVKARRKANGEVEPETPEQGPETPLLDEPVLAPKDYAALVAALVSNSARQPAFEDDDEMIAILLLAA